jgi:hypothetical protein
VKAGGPWLACLAALAIGCSGRQFPQGPTEGFRVRDAQFMAGALPGSAPSAGGASAGAGGGLRITSALNMTTRVVYQDEAGFSLNSTVSTDTFAIGLAVPDLGSGYWVLPPGPPDPATGDLTWTATCDFGPAIPTGLHDLEAVAIGENGQAGTQVGTSLCVDGRVPDNLRACDPTKKPPQAVISLNWDTNVDLDLEVLTPAGNVVDPKHPTTVPPSDAGIVPVDAGQFDRDSNAGCQIDGIRYENLVWNASRPSGRYGIYVNLFDSCKQPSVRFEVSVYTAVADGDGGSRLERNYHRTGELLDFQANGGTGLGLFVTEFVFY